MENVFDGFVGKYPVNKTFTVDLKPVLKENQTLDQFWNEYLNSAMFKNDQDRYEAYPIVKLILDQFHKYFITEALSGMNIEWNELYDMYKNNNRDKLFYKKQEEIRLIIVNNYFKRHKWWSYVSSYSYGSLFSELMPILLQDESFINKIQEENSQLTTERMHEYLKRFKGFSDAFEMYGKSRAIMYSYDLQETTIAYRIVNENFIKFVDNIEIYRKLKLLCPSELENIELCIREHQDEISSLDNVFQPAFFNNCVTQQGIEKYNRILGGDSNAGLLGINNVVNEYFQQHCKESKLKLKDFKMNQLYKQILSDRERLSFLPEQFSFGEQGEKEMMEAINQYFQLLIKQDTLGRLKNVMLLLTSDDVDLDKVYVQGGSLAKLSKLLYGSWDALGESLRKKQVTKKTKKAREELNVEIEQWLENKSFSLKQIQEVDDELKSETSISLMELLTKFTVWGTDGTNRVKVDLLKKCAEGYITSFKNVKVNFDNGTKIRGNDELKDIIKETLDNCLNVLHVAELLRLGKKAPYLDKDSFYAVYEDLFCNNGKLSLVDILPLYNKVRGFLTRKLNDEEKMLLKFDSPQLAKGWDVSKEMSNNATILLDENKYFLLVLNPANKPKLSDAECYESEGNYKKIVYRQVANPAKDLPNLMVIDGKTIRKTGRRENGENIILEALKEKYLPEEINRIRKLRSYLETSPNFNKCDSQEYLAYYMQRIIEYKSGEINFNFKKPEEYDSYTDFLNDLSEQGYSMSFIPFSKEKIQEWVRNGQVFLFQIYNKDFSEGAKGTENMHTLYWKEIFNPNNMNDVIIKLNGKAELFYRKKVQGNPYVHKKDSILVNKIFSNGDSIPSELYKEYLRYFSGKEECLSDKAKEKLSLVKTKIARYDIVKDRRYFEYRFKLHVPFTINFKQTEITNEKFNAYTLSHLKNHKRDINIMGIDRGERNLIYVSIINQRGENIIPPKNFNIIETKTYNDLICRYNYLEKLKDREGGRDEARKNWGKIEKIKDLKFGYLSLVVHEIVKLMVKYNAIIILEDLNFGFKRGRFNIERQVYQNFERMLINKLNYLAFKKESSSPNYGNVWNGLQLTAPFTSFKNLGKQTGWLFYVPAAYTSKIDPLTGFINLFDMKKAKEDPKKFFCNFSSISYKDGVFKFTFNYEQKDSHGKNVFDVVQTDYKKIWTITSKGRRIKLIKQQNGHFNSEYVDITEKLKDLFYDQKIKNEDVTIDRINEITDSGFFKDFFFYFKLILQMRNTEPNNGNIDYLVSPVDGIDSTGLEVCEKLGLPAVDADANGAYHIALKGLYWLSHDFPVEKGFLKYITHKEWIEFAQKKPYRNND